MKDPISQSGWVPDKGDMGSFDQNGRAVGPSPLMAITNVGCRGVNRGGCGADAQQVPRSCSKKGRRFSDVTGFCALFPIFIGSLSKEGPFRRRESPACMSRYPRVRVAIPRRACPQYARVRVWMVAVAPCSAEEIASLESGVGKRNHKNQNLFRPSGRPEREDWRVGSGGA